MIRRRLRTYASVLLIWNPLVVLALLFLQDGLDGFLETYPVVIVLSSVPAFVGVTSGAAVEAVERIVYVRRGLPAPQHTVSWHAMVAAASIPLGVWLGDRAATALFGHRAPSLGEYAREIGIGAVVLMGFVMYRSVLELREARRKAELAMAKLEAERLRASLDALTAQMNPHFLFNALNTVASLVHKDADRAEEVVLELADVYRAVLEATKRPRATLADELALVRSYCAIEVARFGAGLATEIEIEPGIDVSAVPFAPLVVQPLVENAIKHGVRSGAGGGRVGVHVRRADDRIAIEVRDDGVGIDGSRSKGTGTGIANVRVRLTLLYGERAQLELASPPEGGTVATVTVPIEVP